MPLTPRGKQHCSCGRSTFSRWPQEFVKNIGISNMLGTIGRAIKSFLLLTLPINILPIFSAVYGGVTFSIWHNRHINDNTDKFLYEIKDSLNDWGNAYTGLPLTTFSGYNEQILSIISGDRLYEQFEPYDSMQQTLVHFNEHIDELWDAKGTVLNRINKMDHWMVDHVTKPLGVEDVLGVMHSLVCMLVASVTEALVMEPARLIWQVVEDFLGRPKRGDWILGDVDDLPQEPANIMDDIMGGFWASVEEKMAKHKSSATETYEAVVT